MIYSFGQQEKAMNNNELIKQAYSIEEFCQVHSFSRAKFYLLVNEGLAPTIMKVGRRVIISMEAAAAWRRMMEERSSTSEVLPGDK